MLREGEGGGLPKGPELRYVIFEWSLYYNSESTETKLKNMHGQNSDKSIRITSLSAYGVWTLPRHILCCELLQT